MLSFSKKSAVLALLASITNLSGNEPSRISHPLQKLYGDQSEIISVGHKMRGILSIVNPRLYGEPMGEFDIPSEASFLNGDMADQRNVLNLWSIHTDASRDAREVLVPPETGRAVQLKPSTHPVYRDILVKGTGPVQRFITDNKLRPQNLGFDGYFEVSEGIRDLITSEILDQAGVWTSRGLGVVDNMELVPRGNLPEPLRMGTYVRGFRIQTRLSNLADLSVESRKASIDDAIARLGPLLKRKDPMSYTDYFVYMTRRLAKSAAIYQSIGYTQDSLHNGQVTLAGELTDLGVGTFEKPKKPGVSNTKYPWFRYERQPVLFQNMLYKTHAVKAEPFPVELSPSSESVKNQDSLFGIIKSFSPESAAEIERLNPSRLFWESYEQFYREFDLKTFKKRVLNRYREFYDWDPKPFLAKMAPNDAQKVERVYNDVVKRLEVGTLRDNRWGPQGLPSLQKQSLFRQISRQMAPSFEQPKFLGSSGPWNVIERPRDLLDPSHRNLMKDLSWKPDDLERFHRGVFGPHPLEEKLLPRNKIVWVTRDGVSPFAIRTNSLNDGPVEIEYEDPLSGKIVQKSVSRDEFEKFNNPNKKFGLGIEVAGTRLLPGKDLRNRMQLLQERTRHLIPNPTSDSPEAIQKKQIEALYELSSTAATHYETNLDPAGREEYLRRLKKRLSGKAVMDIEKAMIDGCGNCMDQALFTATAFDAIAEKMEIDYDVYISRDVTKNGNHWHIIATLQPSQTQYVVESSFPGPRVFPLRLSTHFERWPLDKIIDQFGGDPVMQTCIPERLMKLLNLSGQN